mgnify:CR=1 FL=1
MSICPDRRNLQKSQKLSTVLAAGLLTILLAPIGIASGTTAPLTPAQIRAMVQSMDILQPESQTQVYAAYENGVATVCLLRHGDATAEDCKIDAVMLTRKLMKLDTGLRLARCLFYDSDRQNAFWDVKVRASLVTAFGAGTIDGKTLLNSVILKEDSQVNALSERYKQVTYRGILDEDSVVGGPFAESRLALALRLKSLKAHEVDISQFNEDFLRIEDAARRGNRNGLKLRIDSTNKSIDQYVQSLIATGRLPAPLTRLTKNPQLHSPASNANKR